MNNNEIIRIVSIIKKWVVSKQLKEGERLPPFRKLLTICQCSDNSLTKALESLTEQRFLYAIRGKGIFLGKYRDYKETIKPNIDQAQRLFNILESQIKEGILNIGSSLPPIKTFCTDYNLSRKTVIQILRKMEMEKLIYQNGRQRIVGAPKDMSRVILQGKKVVLFVVFKYQDWVNYWDDVGFGPFLDQMTYELEKQGFTYKIYETHNSDFQKIESCDGVINSVKDLGMRCAGLVILYHPRRFENINVLLSSIAHFKFPKFLVSRVPFIVSQRILKNDIYIFEPMEQEAHRILAENIVNQNHKRIAFIWQGASESWIEERSLHLSNSFGAINSANNLDCQFFAFIDPSKEFFDKDEFKKLGNFLRIKGTLPIKRALENVSFENFPSLDFKIVHFIINYRAITKALRDGVTAIVAPNDQAANKILSWMLLAGVNYPREVSVYGYDNSEIARIRGISSVDFGFRQMGYIAAHVVLQNVIPKRSAHNSVIIHPMVNERLSSALAPPNSAYSKFPII